MTHPTFPHSCFSAATLRAHKDAEQKVIAAAKACVTSEEWSEDGMVMYTADMIALADAVEALRAVEGDV
jgi:hypothetical protein